MKRRLRYQKSSNQTSELTKINIKINRKKVAIEMFLKASDLHAWPTPDNDDSILSD